MARPHLPVRLRHFITNAQGSALAITVLALPVILGAAALAIDTGVWYMAKRQTQQQADTAALGVARTKRDGGAASMETLRAVALRDAVRNGYHDVSPNSLTLNTPPASGAYAGSPGAIEVIVQRQVPAFFAHVLGLASTTVRARAVVRLEASDACVLALSSDASRALNISGSTTVDASSCGLGSNSTADDAVRIGGNASLDVKSITTSGSVEVSGHITVNEPTLTGQAPIPDPYADLAVPTVGACRETNFKADNTGDVTIEPGVYCNGITMSGSGTLYLKPGTYIIDKGDFKMSGQGRIRCDCTSETDGVTIILTATSGSVGTVSISGSGDVELSAPGDEGNPYKGILFFQDPNAPEGNKASLNGGAAMKLSGAIYMPRADITYSGSSTLAPGKSCTSVVGLTVEMTGNSGLTLTDCNDMGVETIKVDRTITLSE